MAGGLDINGFHDLGVEIDELANNFDEMSKRHGEDTVREAIEAGVARAFDQNIVPEARRNAKEYVPDGRENTIFASERGWIGDEYRHDMRSDDIIVASHEFGSGIHSLNGRGTVDVPGEGYFIPKPPGSGPLKLSGAGDADVFVEYVVHPGVEPKRFMYRALVDNSDMFAAQVGGQLSRIMRERGLI